MCIRDRSWLWSQVSSLTEHTSANQLWSVNTFGEQWHTAICHNINHQVKLHQNLTSRQFLIKKYKIALKVKSQGQMWEAPDHFWYTYSMIILPSYINFCLVLLQLFCEQSRTHGRPPPKTIPGYLGLRWRTAGIKPILHTTNTRISIRTIKVLTHEIAKQRIRQYSDDKRASK